MLTIHETKQTSFRLLSKLGVVLGCVTGLYVAALYVAPALPMLHLEPLSPDALAKIKPSENRLIIPSLNLNIPYFADDTALASGNALWRNTNLGSPADGGNFVLAAQHLSVQPTPGATIKQSPFYNLQKLKEDDKILVDFNGKRYGYSITKHFEKGTPLDTLDAKTTQPTMTLYTCGTTCTDSRDRVALTAEPMGEVRVATTER